MKNINKFKNYEPASMAPPLNLFWKKAKDSYIWDNSNRKYIDFTSTIFVTNIGHGNKTLKKKIFNVLNSPLSHTYTYYNKYREEYVKKLINFFGNKKLNKCFFLSSGSEAIEAAFKLTRLNGTKINKKKSGIISLKGNWHGRTMAAQMLSNDKSQSLWITSKDKNIYHIDFPYPWHKDFDKKSFFSNSLKKTFKKNFNFRNKIAGIFIEAFQGWGALFYPKLYIKELVKFAKKNKILIIIDEIQSGFARTGKKFAFEHYSFTPDIVCCAKGMGSGVPISGVVSSKKIIDINNSFLSSTHSGNPISCAAGIATLDEIKRLKLVTNAKIKGNVMFNHLNLIKKQNEDLIYRITGKGLIAAIIFKKYKNIQAARIATKICKLCLKDGLLLCNTNRDSIKLGPPLIIKKSEITKAMKIISKSIIKFKKEYN